MSTQSRCPQCDGPVEPGEVCQACLMGLGMGTATEPPLESALPERIGPYRPTRILGEGGMGLVYLAEQKEPVRRTVALKVIKRGMDTDQVIARFEAERQALALMNHVNVAKVFDAGATPDGRPYFVMEHVEGVPITEYCDRNRLTTRERLDLFAEVCAGVQHAHQNAIIHRDIKPSNVLVATQGDRRIPKIIDFGVAKATAQRLTERTVFTELGQLIGTPEYMSPEQAEMTAESVDTRTDVYSLGVLLYELLVGALPFDSKELRRAGFDEIRRRIREEEPSKPSTRISTLGDEATASARNRRTDAVALARQLRGDLDWITMKALEKDRTRRYASPNELAADIGRHLRHEPVIAGPPSTVYRMTKFVRRHRIGVAVALAAVLSLAVFAVRERMQAARIAHEAATAEQVSEFLVGLFEVSNPSEARGNSITAREILDQGAKEIDATLQDQPQVQARLMVTMGNVYRSLGLYSQAEPLLLRALDIQRSSLGEDDRRTLSTEVSLAGLYLEQGRFDEAERLIVRTLEAQRRVLGEEHPDTLVSVSNLAVVYENMGRYDDSERLAQETVAIRKRVLGEAHRDTLAAVHNLAMLYESQGRHAEAESLYRETVATRRRALGDDHPDTITSINNLAMAYAGQGRFSDAEPLFAEVLETSRRVQGPDHPGTLASIANLAALYDYQRRYDEAEPLMLEALETQTRKLGEEHRDTLISKSNLALLYRHQGRLDEATALEVETLQTRRRVLGVDHPDTLRSMEQLAVLYATRHRYDDANRIYLETLESRKRVLGTDHPLTARCLYNLACLESLRGNRRTAIDWLRQSVDAGYGNADAMLADSDLEPLHGPEFDALVERARAQAETARAE